MKTTLTGLNDEQQTAVSALAKGSVTVLAGPGSGKTHTLTAAAQSLPNGPKNRRTLCLTFTAKAADNLRNRLKQQPGLFVGTFHALAAQLLGDDTAKLQLISNEEIATLLAELKRRFSLSGTNLRELSLVISRFKNGSLQTAAAKQLTAAYDSALKTRGLFDYDDLILNCIDKLSGTTAAAYAYIFVDEFQDTSPRQYDLLRKLAGPDTKLFVIGDPQQSIYRFRGADGSVFERLAVDFRPQRIHLSQNYRSARCIVAVANRLVPVAAGQQAIRPDQGLVRHIETLDECSEADYALRTIEQALGGTEWHRTHHDQYMLAAGKFQDFALLCRTRRQATLLAEKLRGGGLPVQCLGEDSPYAGPLVQCIQAILAHALQPGPIARLAAIKTAERAKITGAELLLDSVDQTLSPSSLIHGLASQLSTADDDVMVQFENLALPYSDLRTFLEYVAKLSEQAFFDPAADAICVSTIHSSKGLEFRHVLLAGCEQGLLPNARAIELEELAEERRLFYVAVTRARDSLLLLHARRRKHQLVQPSSFLASLQLPLEIDETLAATEQARQRSRQKRAQQRLL